MALSKQFWKFLWIGVVTDLGMGLLSPVLVPYLVSMGHSDSWISAVFAIAPFVIAFFSPFLGFLTDRISRSFLLKVVILTQALTIGLYWFGAGWSVVLAQVLDAVSVTTIGFVTYEKMQQAVGAHERGRTTGILLSLNAATKILGPIAGGFLAQYTFGLPFGIAIGVSLSSLLLLGKSTYHPSPKKKQSFWDEMKDAFLHKELWPLNVLALFTFATYPVIGVVLPLHITKTLGMGTGAVGVALAAFSVGNLLQYFFGMLADKTYSRLMMLVGTTVRMVAIALFAVFFTEYYALLAALFLFGLGTAAWHVVSWAQVAQVAENTSIDGAIFGVYKFFTRIGMVISFVGISVLLSLTSYSTIYVIMAVVGVLGVLVVAAMYGKSLMSSPATV